MPRRRFASAALILTLSVVPLAACGSNQFDKTDPGSPAAASATPTGEPFPLRVEVLNRNDLTKRPFVQPKGDIPPTELETEDFIVGNGKEAKPTDTVTVQYVGVVARNSQEFDASWDRGQPSTFALSDVVPGFRDGIVGMKEGGRRQIIIPADQAYGAQGAGSLVGPNEALIFIVDLIKVN
jgi:peptidylprolyl isomerase